MADLLSSLPKEILELVIDQLDIQSLVQLAQTNHKWNHLALGDKIWKKRCEENGWDYDERRIHQFINSEGYWQNNYVKSGYDPAGFADDVPFIHEVSKREILYRSQKTPSEGYYNLYKEFYTTNQPCIPSDLTTLRSLAFNNFYPTIGAGVFILVRPSGYHQYLKYDSNQKSEQVNFLLRPGRYISAWVGSDVPTDESVFSDCPYEIFIPDIHEHVPICPFCSKPSQWRAIFRQQVNLSHEDYYDFEAQCKRCSRYLLFGTGNGC